MKSLILVLCTLLIVAFCKGPPKYEKTNNCMKLSTSTPGKIVGNYVESGFSYEVQLCCTNPLAPEDTLVGKESTNSIYKIVEDNFKRLNKTRNDCKWSGTAIDNMSYGRWLPAACASLAPALLPPAHIAILWYFWQSYARYVDKRYCSCSCWDTVFKGPYESGIASYKHMYFNATKNTMKMWLLTVICIIALYECIKQLIALIIQSRIRYSMLVIFNLSIFSHYYSWWVCVNYYNDDFYKQWNHQLFFTLTEIIGTIMVMHLANIENPVTSKKILSISGIALLHIVAGSYDQFIMNVIRGEGYAHQVVRDIGFMIPDFLQLIAPLWLYQKTRRECYTTKPFNRDRNLHKDIIAMFFFIFLLLTICSIL